MKRWSDSVTTPIADIRVAIARVLAEQPRAPERLYRPAFLDAWSRRWNAHYLYEALGYPSKEPVIR